MTHGAQVDTPSGFGLARTLGLVAGIGLAAGIYALAFSRGLDQRAAACAGVAVLMACWWLTEAIPLAATALLPVVLLPVLGIAPIGTVLTAYASDVIFLFLGGMLLAAAIERHGLHLRVGLRIVSTLGSGPRALVGAVMLATALLSMWVSNTATALMMIPIATGIASLHGPSGAADGVRAPSPGTLRTCLVLGVAYAASIGGIGTLIGTPPNSLLASFAHDPARAGGMPPITFASWLAVGLPFVAIFLPLAWMLLVFVLVPVGDGADAGSARASARERLRELGPLSMGERVTLGVFLVTAALWIARGPIVRAFGLTGTAASGASYDRLTDAGIAVGAALSLFVIPVSRRPLRCALEAADFGRVNLGVLLLFGGGLALSSAMSATGLDRQIAGLVPGLAGAHPLVMTGLIVTGMVFFGELASNTAATALALPVLFDAAEGLGVPPATLLVPATIAASCGFMLPTATPPNAIAYGTGLVNRSTMIRAGLVLDIAAIVVITATAPFAGRLLGAS